MKLPIKKGVFLFILFFFGNIFLLIYGHHVNEGIIFSDRALKECRVECPADFKLSIVEKKEIYIDSLFTSIDAFFSKGISDISVLIFSLFCSVIEILISTIIYTLQILLLF